jgi:hypothetical protein
MSLALGCVVGVNGCFALEELDEASMISGGSWALASVLVRVPRGVSVKGIGGRSR